MRCSIWRSTRQAADQSTSSTLIFTLIQFTLCGICWQAGYRLAFDRPDRSGTLFSRPAWFAIGSGLIVRGRANGVRDLLRSSTDRPRLLGRRDARRIGHLVHHPGLPAQAGSRRDTLSKRHETQRKTPYPPHRLVPRPVLGANDGIVSTAASCWARGRRRQPSKASSWRASPGLVAGAMSMAAGEFVSSVPKPTPNARISHGSAGSWRRVPRRNTRS